MNAAYSQQWAKLRKSHRRLLMMVIGIPLTAFLALGFQALLDILVDHGLLVNHVLELFCRLLLVGVPGLAAMGQMLWLWAVFVKYMWWSWPCPRCGKPFTITLGGLWSNPFAQRCFHCGLPKWADSDPDSQ